MGSVGAAGANLIPLRRVIGEVATGHDLTAVRTDGKSVTLTSAEIRELNSSLAGGVLLAGQNGYDDARRLWNGAFDRHPAGSSTSRSTRIAHLNIGQLADYVSMAALAQIRLDGDTGTAPSILGLFQQITGH